MGNGNGLPHEQQKRASRAMGILPQLHWNCANHATTDAEGPIDDTGPVARDAHEAGLAASPAMVTAARRRGSYRLGKSARPGGCPGEPNRFRKVDCQCSTALAR
mmetsp:Transcript_81358/g.235213  ORF Transcript_81358/g.235213 Transcript_81358/m.235213 type:complete len:104 (-) Transcript_81358:145-456(-)